MNAPNKLTIEISLHPTASKLTANCVEFQCLAIAGDLHSLLEALKAQIDNEIFDSYESGELNPTPFIKQLYGDEDSENWVDWIEETRYYRQREKLELAFLQNYPLASALQTHVYYNIPSIWWDGGNSYEQDLARQEAAYDALINQGSSSQVWIDFVQWIAVYKIGFMAPESKIIMGRSSVTRNEQYQKWVDLGLPVQPLNEIIDSAQKLLSTERELSRLKTVV